MLREVTTLMLVPVSLSPSSIGNVPTILFIRVDLPAPLGPSKPILSPGQIVNATFERIGSE